MSYGARNSKAAQEYADKRAASIKISQENRLKRKSNDEINHITNNNNSSSLLTINNYNNQLQSINKEFSEVPSNVDVYSYGDYCERIIVRNPNKVNTNTTLSTQKQLHNEYQHINNNNNCIYLNPPIDSCGMLYDISDRPILCSSMTHKEIVFGSADHALYSIPLTSHTNTKTSAIKPSRLSSNSSSSDVNNNVMSMSSYITMYSKSFGHTDWVTSLAHLVRVYTNKKHVCMYACMYVCMYLCTSVDS